MRKIYILIWIIAISNLQSCKGNVPSFIGNEAFKSLVQQCSFGPRNPGSEGYEACKNYLIENFGLLADTVWTQNFTEKDPYTGEIYDLSNIIIQFAGDNAQEHVLLGAHWDTRPWADMEQDEAAKKLPILGANDGASGVAVLMEMARLFKQKTPPVSVTIVLFDGEDLGEPGVPESYGRGSQYFSKNLPIDKPDEGIIVDMVGDADLEIPIERFSYQIHPSLVKSLWQKAQNLNLEAFQNKLGIPIYDDHIPLWENAGIPVVDLIDFNYPNRYSNYWHTQQDIPENCSPSSLEQVGKLLTHYVYELKTNE